jgi:hypothetical protein
VFKSTSNFLPDSRLIFRSLLFIADKMGDMSLQEPKSREVAGSDTGRFPPTLVRVGLACEARLRYRSSRSVKSESDSSGDNIDHHKICCLMQQIQSTIRRWSLILTVAEKSSWWGRVNRLPTKPKQRSLERAKKKSPERLNWPMKPTKQSRKDTETGKMTREHRRMKLRMVPPPGGTTPSLSSIVRPAETDSETGL